MSLLCSGLKDGLFQWTLKFHEYISKGLEKRNSSLSFHSPIMSPWGLVNSLIYCACHGHL